MLCLHRHSPGRNRDVQCDFYVKCHDIGNCSTKLFCKLCLDSLKQVSDNKKQ